MYTDNSRYQGNLNGKSYFIGCSAWRNDDSLTPSKRPDGLPQFLIIIDALDEVEDEGGSEFLKDLLQVIQQNGLHGLKFLVTSRPDHSIVSLCDSFASKAVCHLREVDTKNVNEDIMTFLKDKLPALENEKDLEELARRADGLFIYAATGVRYISPSHPRSSDSEKRSRLKKLLQGWPQPQGHEVLLVDVLSKQIVASALGDLEDDYFQTRLDILHAILCSTQRISTLIVTDLLNVDKDTVEIMVQSLHPVLYTSSKDNCIYRYHASFPDFIFDSRRSHFTVPDRRSTLNVACD